MRKFMLFAAYVVFTCALLASCSSGGDSVTQPTEDAAPAQDAVPECVFGDKQCKGLILRICDSNGAWQDKAACQFICQNGACTGNCAPGSKQCKGHTPQTCDTNGNWLDGSACAFVCQDGECTGECVPNASKCNGQVPQVCDANGKWQSKATCQFLCQNGTCAGQCAPGSKQCEGNTPQTCDANGAWQNGTDCPFVCASGVCAGICQPGSKQCNGTIPQTCESNGAWKDNSACQFVCANGDCAGACNPGDVQCNGLIPQSCDTQGVWQDGTACPYVCASGSCAGSCVPNAKQCNGNIPQTCDANGAWQDGTVCQFVCENGDCAGACTPGNKQCNGNVPQSCVSGQWQNGNVCPFVCQSGDCIGTCVPNNKKCTGLTPQTCDANGVWQNGTDCPFICSAGTCSGVCVPNSKDCSGNTPLTCTVNGTWQGGTACQYVCQNGNCTGVCTPGAKQCNGNVPQTCDANGQWQDGSACSGAMTVCCSGNCVSGTVAQVATGWFHTCVRKQNGTLWCFGMDGYGQLGDGQYVYQKIPVNVSTLGANVVDVHADGYNTCARKNDGTLWCWGYNSNGQLGDGTKGGESCNLNQFCQSLPIQVVQLSNKSAGVSLSSIHVCAFENTGWLWCWGYNMDGQLGLGYKNASVLSPALVGATGSNVIEVAAGSNHTCARKTDGTVWCWGYGHNGELGDGHSNLQDPIPTQVVNLDTNAVQISAGGSHSCAVKNDGTAWCWGRNAYGEIGDGTDINRGVPTQITSLGNSVSEISAGFYHTCARKTDGTVWCWGWNVSGQLGDGTTTNKNLPVQVTLLGSDAAQLSLGGNYEYGQSCALKTNGTVWCWGNNIYGQLGNGQTALVVSSPVQANTLNCQ